MSDCRECARTAGVTYLDSVWEKGLAGTGRLRRLGDGWVLLVRPDGHTLEWSWRDLSTDPLLDRPAGMAGVPNLSTLIGEGAHHLRLMTGIPEENLRAEFCVDLRQLEGGPADVQALAQFAQAHGVPVSMVEKPPIGDPQLRTAIEVVVYQPSDQFPAARDGHSASVVILADAAVLANSVELARLIGARP